MACLDRAHELTFGPIASERKDPEGASDMVSSINDMCDPMERLDKPPPLEARVEAAPLRAMRRSCHLNIAACYLLRQRDYHSAIDNCSRVLDTLLPSSSSQVVDAKSDSERAARLAAHLRRADALKKIGHFQEGIEDVRFALTLCSSEAAETDVSKRLSHIIFTETQFK